MKPIASLLRRKRIFGRALIGVTAIAAPAACSQPPPAGKAVAAPEKAQAPTAVSAQAAAVPTAAAPTPVVAAVQAPANPPREASPSVAEPAAEPAAMVGVRQPAGVAPSHKAPAAPEEKAITVKLNPDWGNSGGDAKTELGKIVSRKNSAMQRCYHTWTLEEGPRATNLKVKATMTIGTEGTVIDVKVVGAPPSLSVCMTAKFLAIRGLPALPSPQDFSQSYVFVLEQPPPTAPGPPAKPVK